MSKSNLGAADFEPDFGDAPAEIDAERPSKSKLTVVEGGTPPARSRQTRRRRPRRPGRFTQADLIKVLKAAQRAGTPIASVRIEPDGAILVVPGDPNRVTSSQPNPWDDD